MRYLALACDYDGTLATHGVVDAETIASLQRLAASGRRLLLVTGRELPELKSIFPEWKMFAAIVAENGGLLVLPDGSTERCLSASPSDAFVKELVARGVGPISIGQSIVATWEPHESTVLATIRDLGLDLQVIFNKGAVMILPSGVNKATGLKAALRELELSRHNVVAIGDAENDHAFLQYCEIGVATANALPALKEHAELTTHGDHGRGVTELIDRMLADDLASLSERLRRHTIKAPDGRGDWRWLPGHEHLVLHGSPGSLGSALPQVAQALSTAGYQYCLFSGEGDAPAENSLQHTALLGGDDKLPQAEDVLHNLQRPEQSVHVVLPASIDYQQSHELQQIIEQLSRWQSERSRPHVILLPPARELLAMNMNCGELLRRFPSVVLAADDVVALGDITAHRVVLANASAWRPVAAETSST
ncbi:MAG TPA: HAD-IIB family hydrolase [Pirellulaceae bacterium]|nr:HAD-IIB family hydrolase [Pirellulaceae bacterium]